MKSVVRDTGEVGIGVEGLVSGDIKSTLEQLGYLISFFRNAENASSDMFSIREKMIIIIIRSIKNTLL